MYLYLEKYVFKQKKETLSCFHQTSGKGLLYSFHLPTCSESKAKWNSKLVFTATRHIKKKLEYLYAIL